MALIDLQISKDFELNVAKLARRDSKILFWHSDAFGTSFTVAIDDAITISLRKSKIVHAILIY